MKFSHQQFIKIPYLIFAVLQLFFIDEPKAQEDTHGFARNVFYLEGFGIGGYGSFNYERIKFIKQKINMGFGFGAGTYNLRDFTNKFNPDVVFPISLKGLYGNNHKLELGLGQTLSSIVEANGLNKRPYRRTGFHSGFILGYRYQKDAGGLVFRFAYTPVIEFYEFYRHWGGISIGYAF